MTFQLQRYIHQCVDIDRHIFAILLKECSTPMEQTKQWGFVNCLLCQCQAISLITIVFFWLCKIRKKCFANRICKFVISLSSWGGFTMSIELCEYSTDFVRIWIHSSWMYNLSLTKASFLKYEFLNSSSTCWK